MNLKNTAAAAALLLATATFANAETCGASMDGASAGPACRTAPTRETTPTKADDQGFDVDELLDIILNWGTRHSEGDLNGDNMVNIDDLVGLFVRMF